MNMNVETIELFLNAIEEAGYSPRTYSGRAMYGKQCVGVPLERWQSDIDFVLDVIEAMHGVEGLSSRVMRDSRSDSMGRGSILYWPTMRWPEGRDAKKDVMC
jgi:hypothetical protein